ncbi:MAG: GNAT family N-acetyltransferase [Defluviitaleaceae bacterium]|nr:GNAT family N-acetyltransferase [Defluviitaleaceae bacterium]
MKISYQEINANLLENIAIKYGEVAKNHIHTEDDSYSLAAMHDDVPIGFISTYTRNLDAPIGEERDAYIDIIEVDDACKRMGIATELVKRTEAWAMKNGLLQIRAWSSQDKTEAIPMWRNLGYGLCPAKIWLERHNIAVDGYYVVKQLNPINPYPHVTKCIKQDLQEISPRAIHDFRLIRAKGGVYVYKCRYDNIPAVVKHFENEDDRRELLNYRILAQHGIPTIKTYAIGKTSLVMEDISVSEDWRLGVAEDLTDVDVAKSLAHWYFKFHENGANISELDTLFFEFAQITVENLQMLLKNLPEAQAMFDFLLVHYDKFHKMIFQPAFTMTYNDFYWSNFVVRKDKKAAMMFDYNLMGKGYRLSDFRNVCWSMSDEAKKTFQDEYHRQYIEKHNNTRTEAEKLETRIDDVAGPVYALIVAYTGKENFPNWAEGHKKEAVDGSLLSKAKQLLL